MEDKLKTGILLVCDNNDGIALTEKFRELYGDGFVVVVIDSKKITASEFKNKVDDLIKSIK